LHPIKSLGRFQVNFVNLNNLSVMHIKFPEFGRGTGENLIAETFDRRSSLLRIKKL
jgi:hypothetical protein